MEASVRKLRAAVLAATLIIYFPAPAHGSSARTPMTAAAVTTATATGAWTTYHRDNAHTGYDPTLPAIASVAPGWTSPSLTDDVYTEPLVYNGLVYVGTLDNTVYALRQFDGSIEWSTNLGFPATGGWRCGNINPTGILGTPVIDTSTNRIYFVAFLASSSAYYLFGLDLQTGGIRLKTLILPAGFDWTIQQQRGALALGNGFVYVTFGGRIGDCGDYHGYVIAVPTDGSTSIRSWHTPSSGNGMWAAGGAAIDDATGAVIVSTGNGVSSGCSSINYNDAVIRFNAGITDTSPPYFMPEDWQNNWCANDQDLGSASPVLISSTLAFQAGKRGNGFLVNPQNLGGVDGQLFPTPKPATYVGIDVCLGDHNDANFGSYAYMAPYVYLSCDGHGIVGLQVDTVNKTFTSCNATCAAPSWHAPGTSTLGPPIVAGGAVWAVSVNGGGIYALNATTGATIFHSASFTAPHFSTPSSAGNQVFVSAGTQIRSFVMTPPITATASAVFPQRALGTTSSAMTLTLTNGSASSVTVSSVDLSGANLSEFTKGTDNCSTMVVAAAGTCTVQFTFTPTDNGVRNATVTFTNTGPNNPTSALVGTGGASEAARTLYLPWYDLSSAGVMADTIHIANPSGALASGTITLPGATTLNFNVGPGQDSFYSFPAGAIGGPVVINSSTVPILGSLRAWYYQSFNETQARPAIDAATTLYFPWYDLSSAGMRADTIHVTVPGGVAATGTIHLPGATDIPFNVAAGTDAYFSFPTGTIGGPVTITSSQPVLATLRAWYYQSFNETAARGASAATTTQYFPWYDLSSPGMRGDTIHITNVSGATAAGTIALAGATSINFSVSAGMDMYFSFPVGTIGGPVTITSDHAILSSLRAWYYQSFNEVAGRSSVGLSAIQYLPWYDLSSPGTRADTIHVTNPGGATVTGTVTKVGNQPLNLSVGAGQDMYVSFPTGSVGGPVTIRSSAAVIVSLRAWYNQSFNEVPGVQ
jgi:Abnormal spindle-like microcephaly-assoc'd, ASPM-SPD-2-Hydin/PQQ-like domain